MHREADDAVCLPTVADPAQVLTPGRLLGEAGEIWSGDMVVMPEFTAA